MEEAQLSQAEEACSYAVYPPPGADLPVELAEITALIAGHTRDYIWHHDSFSLHITRERLEGRTRFGDCIDDEWYIVWLIRELTKSRKGWVASIKDNDGQFLLIEAAEVLPKWVSPANAEHRVYIADGRLHLVPLEHKSTPPALEDPDELEEEGYIDPAEAVRLVRDPDTPTLAPDAVEQAVWSRIAGYPSGVTQTHAHRTIAYLPPDIAAALQAQPQLVAAATRCFYERDPVQLKASRAMSRFPPVDAKATSVRMTRPLYAQLVAQRFYAPKPFEKAKWFDGAEPESVEYRRRDVGMKLTCGFEMLYQETISSLRTSSIARPTQTEPAYDRFRQRLTELGYFRGELQGSKLYTELEVEARRRWEALPAQPAFASEVEAAISSASMMGEEELREDDDSWLDLDPEALEEMLKAKGEAAEEEEDRAAQAEADKLAGFADKLGRFVDGEGSMEGALFDDEVSDDDSEDEEMAPTEDERRAKMATLVPDLPASDWGAKVSASEPKPAAGKPEHRLEGLEQEQLDGVSDEEDDEDEDMDEPALAGDFDMANEMDDFLKFTREALGISEAHYGEILEQRAERGAFVPRRAKGKQPAADLPPVPPAMRQSAVDLQHTAQSSRNPNLDSFEALMSAMDAELQKGKPVPKAKAESTAMDEDAELDAELADLLERDEEGADYTLIKNFLESYRSQGGAAGPVSTLAGRLDVPLPGSRSG